MPCPAPSYHVRECEAGKLLALAGGIGAGTAAPIDLFVSHDWPAGIAHHGDTAQLVRQKPFLRAEIADGSLGSPPGREILDAVRPRHWFAAHMHCKFAAVVHHALPSLSGQNHSGGRVLLFSFWWLGWGFFVWGLCLGPGQGRVGPARLVHVVPA
jgi:hypothetical protein